MSFRDLRRHAAEIDEAHHESMRTIEDDLGERHFGTGTPAAASRRNFLRRAATGGAIAFGATAIPVASMVPSALAQTGGTTPAGTTPGTTPAASADGKAPSVSGDDLTIAVFAGGIELAAAAAYGLMIDSGKLTSAVAQTARTFMSHHIDHAAALATFTGSETPTGANRALLVQLTPQIKAAETQRDVLLIAYGIETGAAATYEFAMGSLEEWELAGAAATILPVEAQHAVAWSLSIEPDPTEWAKNITTYVPNFQNSAAQFSPSQYAS